MNRLKVEVLFILPRAMTEGEPATLAQDRLPARRPGGIRIRRVTAPRRSPYPVVEPPTAPAEEAAAAWRRWRDGSPLRVLGAGTGEGYGGDLIGKIERYANRCVNLTEGEDFEVIHAHDWMTFPAGIRLAERSGKPLIVHVHATEFDRSGYDINGQVYDLERAGMRAAAQIIAVSNLTRHTIVTRYGIDSDKVQVVHNGIEFDASRPLRACASGADGPMVLFLGRLTRQKGPLFFLDAAEQVLGKFPRARFTVAGWGDLAPRMIERVAARGLGHKIFFTGFLRGADVDRAFRRADVYVMPSVSEPFGLTALEAVRNGTPVIVSRTSGVAEVLGGGALQVDFWDVNQLAEKISALLQYPELRASITERAQQQLPHLGWDQAAKKTLGIYSEQIEAVAGPGIGQVH